MRVPFIIRAPVRADARAPRGGPRALGGPHADRARSDGGPPAEGDRGGQPGAADDRGPRRPLDLEGYAEALYPLHHYGWSDLRAWRAGRYKVIDAPRPELYDLERDPEETKNLYADRRTLGGHDDRPAAQQRRTRHEPRARRSRRPRSIPRLARGWRRWAMSGRSSRRSSSADTTRADPKDKIELFNLMTDAREVAQEDGTSVRAGRLDAQAGRRRGSERHRRVVQASATRTTRSAGSRRPSAYFQRALALKPDYDLPVINMANAYRKLGSDEAALAGYEHYLSLDPKNAHVRYQVGEIYLDRGDVERAERDFRQALEIDPSVASARNALGVIAFRRGDLATAEREVRGGAGHEERRAAGALQPRADRGGAWRPAMAEAEYRRELEIHAAAYKAAFNLGRLYERLGDRPAQIAALKQAVEINARRPRGELVPREGVPRRGHQLRRGGRASRAGRSRWRRARRLAPLAHYVIADLYNRLGRSQDAAREVAAGRALEAGRPRAAVSGPRRTPGLAAACDLQLRRRRRDPALRYRRTGRRGGAPIDSIAC